MILRCKRGLSCPKHSKSRCSVDQVSCYRQFLADNTIMFIRQCYRRKNGKHHAYWALVESYRTPRGPRQRIVSYLGEMDAQGRLGIQQAATRQGKRYQHRLFDDVSPQWVEVDTSRIRVERCVDFGGPWLGLELLNHLGIDSLLRQLQPSGREQIEWSLMSLILVICRLCEPSSELHSADHVYIWFWVICLVLHPTR